MKDQNLNSSKHTLPDLSIIIHFLESCYVYQGINYNNTDWEVDEAATVRVMLQYLTGIRLKIEIGKTSSFLFMKMSVTTLLP